MPDDDTSYPSETRELNLSIPLKPDEVSQQPHPQPPNSSPMSQAQTLLRIAEDAHLFHSPEGVSYVSVPLDNHWETYALRESGFKRWLRKRYFERYGGSTNQQAVTDALDALDARAQFEGEEVPVHTRIAGHRGKIYVDLCDNDWRVVEVDEDGWRVVSDSPVRFRRTAAMSPLPEPQHGGDINALRGFLNVDDDGWVMLLGWLIGAFRPAGPYPLLCLSGEQGTAKSTTARVLRSLVDPSRSPLRDAPTNGEELLIAASNCWVPTFDNLSDIKPALSDALCRMSTGGGLSKRRLYSDADEVILDAQRPVIVTGIGNLTTRSDLADRAIVVRLKPIRNTERVAEADYWAKFEQARPSIFGAVLDIVHRAVKMFDSTQLSELPRMADFVKWVAAAEWSFIWDRGTFQRTYQQQREEALAAALDDSIVASAVIKMMQKSDADWIDTPTRTFEAIRHHADPNSVRWRQFPSSADKLTSELQRVAPLLREQGINVETGVKKAGSRLTLITRLPGFASSPSSASNPSPFTREWELETYDR